ncbi:PAS fold [Jannaschia faecimaris]|uniref:PAS fold n=1 Tax=Jannaschia faecimaris TaxID=1244108 RepID=A0A1H3IHT8_9RHOB|nr:PAS-domain containing protein [Jannaschia faecimaris]SDY27403.1 PAS fold [Jannaschia faecimaris]
MSSAGVILIPVLGGFFAGVSALLLVLWLAARQSDRPAALARLDPLGEPRTLRFRNGYLVEHSENVGFLLALPVDRMRAWHDLCACLNEIVPGAAAALRALEVDGLAFRLDGTLASDSIVVIGHRAGPDLCVTVSAADLKQTAVHIDLASFNAITTERDAAIRANETSPTLSWAVDCDGQVTWSNAVYRDLIASCHGLDAARGWPLHAMFSGGDAAQAGRSRRKCRDSDGAEHWFDVTLSAPDVDGVRHGHAIPLDAVIEAEGALRKFIQTLSKSFADLPTGLAIFDQTGNLALFNPVFMDMTGLETTWLSRRPHITDVLDTLRDRQMLSGSRDHLARRRRLADLASGTHTETHIENWAHSDGTSFRMSVRPQGDGAITLLLEDISTETMANLRHRQDRDLFTDLLDSADTGIVTFDPKGKRVATNDVAQSIWFGGGNTIALPKTLASCLTLWSSVCRPTPLWGEIRDLLHGPLEERSSWDQRLATDDGTVIFVRVLPQPDGGLALALRSDRELATLPPAMPDQPALTA